MSDDTMGNLFDDGGFSLMKDLLADLAVDEDDAANWLSLDQLEQELKQLENNTNTSNNSNTYESSLYPTSAAGMVVNSQAAMALQQQHFQAFQSPMGLIPQVQPTINDYNISQYDTNNSNSNNNSVMDAWSLSLQKFTASSLEADFLQADSARKSSSSTVQQQPPTTTAVSNLKFADYNVKESVHVGIAPPPGITPDVSQQLISQAAAKLVQQLQTVEVTENRIPTIPTSATDGLKTVMNNDESLLANQLTRNLQLIHENEVLEDKEDDEDDDGKVTSGLKTPPMKVPLRTPITPQNSVTIPATPRNSINQGSTGTSMSSAPTPMPTPTVAKIVNSVVADEKVTPTFPIMTTMDMAPAAPPNTVMPPPCSAVDGSSNTYYVGMAIATSPMMAMAPQLPLPPPQRVVFANPHPTAPSIPATALSSRYMTARDIAFVVHGMLKPILTSENLGTMSTYHLQYWTRHHPVKPPMPISASKRNGNEDSKVDILSLEVQARHGKTKEWASERKVLGSTGKTDVTRPRALIALSSTKLNTDDDEETKNDKDGVITIKQQRAALWKSRIYCDQAYQCYNAVVDSWNTPSSGMAPSSVHPHLLKLTKCFGISVQTVLVDTGTATTPDDDDAKQFRNQYSVDTKVLDLLFKLPKGKILLARVLEEALLPPTVVQVLLPVAILTLFAAPNSTDDDVAYADDRVLGAWTVVIDTLPDLSGKVIIETVQSLIKQSSTNKSSILSTTERMQCTHALLQRGALIAANDPSFATEWQETETEFMNLISNM